MKSHALWAVVAALAVVTVEASGQGVVVDQGEFSIRIAGRDVGTETFVVRRAGLGRDDAIFANGVVTMRDQPGLLEIRPLLRALPPDGTAESYQVTVTGTDSLDARLARSGRRYVATIRSPAGDEDREFQARAGTRIVDLGVAHQYYFLRDVEEGGVVHTIEPRTRRQVLLTAGPTEEVDLALGPNAIGARRVSFATDEGDQRIVWYDRQGRVLRVEIPSREYIAQWTDLVG